MGTRRLYSVRKRPAAAVRVLYSDCHGRQRPLHELYFSGDSKRLVSDHIEGLAQELEAWYCPHCNAYYNKKMEREALSHRNMCPTCLECPSCASVLGIMELDPSRKEGGGGPQYCFGCSFCRWTSEAVGLVDADPASVPMAAALWEREDPELLHFKQQRMVSPPANTSVSSEKAKWHISDLEEKLQTTARQVSQAVWREASLRAGQEGEDDQPPPELFWRGASSRIQGELAGSRARRAYQFVPAGTQSRFLRPQRVLLRTKRIKRCRQDLTEGRTGLLIKPQGDSSRSDAVGKWFQKDSSAVLYVPRISVTKLPSWESVTLGQPATLILRVDGSPDAAVRLSIKPPPAPMEVEDMTTEDTTTSIQLQMDGWATAGSRGVFVDKLEDEVFSEIDSSAPPFLEVVAQEKPQPAEQLLLQRRKHTVWLSLPVHLPQDVQSPSTVQIASVSFGMHLAQVLDEEDEGGDAADQSDFHVTVSFSVGGGVGGGGAAAVTI